MNFYDYPSNTRVLDDKGIISQAWNQLFTRWQLVISTIPLSGTTAKRPTSNLWVGRRFFDTTLGKPVYLKSLSPSVWVDGVGTVC